MSSWGNDPVPEGWTETDEASYQHEMESYWRTRLEWPRTVSRGTGPPRRTETWDERQERHRQEHGAGNGVDGL